VADKLSVARAVVEGFEARDQERLLSLFSPHAEFFTRVLVLDEHHFKGHDGVRQWLDAVDETYERYEIVDPEFAEGAGDAVVVSCRLSLQYRGDTYGMSRAVHWVFRVDEASGCIQSFTSFRDRSEALEAAGLGS
jgi:hypothetical protein